MSLMNAVANIQNLYRAPNDPLKSEAEIRNVFADAHKQFYAALEAEEDAAVIESCIFADPNWELSVEAREALIRKGKKLGLSSPAFLLDYYSFLSGHLDPCEEKTNARNWVDGYLAKQNSN